MGLNPSTFEAVAIWLRVADGKHVISWQGVEKSAALSLI